MAPACLSTTLPFPSTRYHCFHLTPNRLLVPSNLCRLRRRRLSPLPTPLRSPPCCFSSLPCRDLVAAWYRPPLCVLLATHPRPRSLYFFLPADSVLFLDLAAVPVSILVLVLVLFPFPSPGPGLVPYPSASHSRPASCSPDSAWRAPQPREPATTRPCPLRSGSPAACCCSAGASCAFAAGMPVHLRRPTTRVGGGAGARRRFGNVCRGTGSGSAARRKGHAACFLCCSTSGCGLVVGGLECCATEG